MDSEKEIIKKIQGFEKLLDRTKILLANTMLRNLDNVVQGRYMEFFVERANTAIYHRVMEISFIEDQIMELGKQLDPALKKQEINGKQG